MKWCSWHWLQLQWRKDNCECLTFITEICLSFLKYCKLNLCSGLLRGAWILGSWWSPHGRTKYFSNQTLVIIIINHPCHHHHHQHDQDDIPSSGAMLSTHLLSGSMASPHPKDWCKKLRWRCFWWGILCFSLWEAFIFECLRSCQRQLVCGWQHHHYAETADDAVAWWWWWCWYMMMMMTISIQILNTYTF